VVLRCLEVDTWLQGIEREAVTRFGVREKLGRGKWRRGCLSDSYESGKERTEAGTGAASTWRRRRGAVYVGSRREVGVRCRQGHGCDGRSEEK
jgi:hypothetical protein